MATRLTVYTLIVFFVSMTTGIAQEKDKLALLLNRSPSPANAMGYVNIPSLNQLMADAGFSSRLSESVEEIWFISDLDVSNFQPKWEAGYATLKQPVDVDKLASIVGGYVDTVADRKVVYSAQQAYLVPGADHPERLGILRPANRALLAGWLENTVSVQYNPFLNALANQPDSYLSFMMAVELENVMSPIPLAAKLASVKSLRSLPPESAASILSSVEGFSVIVGRKSLQQCIVKFQFSKSPESLRLVAPEMLAEILERKGLASPEIKTWKATVTDNALALQGPITQSTLSGLLSVFSLQSHAESALGRPGLSADDNEKKQAYEAKYYFDQVNTIIDRTRDYHAQTTGALASWNDKRARQIDELPTLNVDPEMIQYGSDIAQLLRGNALSVRKSNIQAGQVKANQSLGTGYYNDGYGYFNSNRTSDYQRVTDAIVRGNAYGTYREALSLIDELKVAMRRTMTQKYQLQF